MTDDSPVSLVTFVPVSPAEVPEEWRCTGPSGMHAMGVATPSQPKLRVWTGSNHTAVSVPDSVLALQRTRRCAYCSRVVHVEALVPCVVLQPGDTPPSGTRVVQVLGVGYVALDLKQAHEAEERVSAYLRQATRAGL